MRRTVLVAAMATALLVSGCATRAASSAPSSSSERPTSASVERLRALAAAREKSGSGGSYRLGPGDLVEVAVFDLPEMNRKVRVAESGEIQLPLVGSVRAAGRTEAELSREIAGRLSREYLQNPQVDIFVGEYRSRQVAVTGAVAKPGLYSLTRDRYTILDMLSEAGGLTKEAGGFIEFIPADSAGASNAFQMAKRGSSLGGAPEGGGIPIDLSELMRGSNRALLNLPVVGGDVIYVAEAGTFAVEGWIEKPGSYPLSRGMTVLAALSAGGGPLFPAELSRVELLRSSRGDDQMRGVQVIDLNAVREGKAADVPLRSGDVVRVPPNIALVPPWAMFQLFRELIRFGASVAVI